MHVNPTLAVATSDISNIKDLNMKEKLLTELEFKLDKQLT